jgi:catechol 2,3-dioxygenase-like lactoylglutathione lyase family enzyme
MRFSDAQVILFVADTERAAAFYRRFGFQETFRTSQDQPVKIEMSSAASRSGWPCRSRPPRATASYR